MGFRAEGVVGGGASPPTALLDGPNSISKGLSFWRCRGLEGDQGHVALGSEHCRAFFPTLAPPLRSWRAGRQGVEAKASEVTGEPFIPCGLFKEP